MQAEQAVEEPSLRRPPPRSSTTRTSYLSPGRKIKAVVDIEKWRLAKQKVKNVKAVEKGQVSELPGDKDDAGEEVQGLLVRGQAVAEGQAEGSSDRLAATIVSLTKLLESIQHEIVALKLQITEFLQGGPPGLQGAASEGHGQGKGGKKEPGPG